NLSLSLSLFLCASSLSVSLHLSVPLRFVTPFSLSVSLFLSISALNRRRCLDSLLPTLSMPRL
ncbi:hypothetical protein TorRG33x02_225340, partial [Trema orientale]